MLVVHAGVLSRRFFVWVESLDEGERAKARGRSGRPTRRQPARFPFAVDSGSVRDTFAEHVGIGGLPADVCRNVVLWAPTVAGKPTSSRQAAPDSESIAAEIRPFALDVAELSWPQAVDLLCACAGRDVLGSSIFVGETLLFWCEALRHAAALVAREEFVPSVEREESGWFAVWRSAPGRAGIEAQTNLAAAMPTACRALGNDPDIQPDFAAVEALHDAVDRFCDCLIRQSCPTGADTAAPLRTLRRTSTALSRADTRPAFDSLHDQWIAALQAPKGPLEGADSDLRGLAAQIAEWQRPLSLSLAAPFSLVFRLEEPVLARDDDFGEEGEWYVRYLLQSVADPSLFVPAEEAWQGKGPSAGLLRQPGFSAREFLLAGLGQASRISPHIEASLKQATPGGCALDTRQAHEFLTETAWLLEQAGFVVQLPAWWARRGKHRLTARASVKSPSMKSTAGLSADSILEFDWQVALGGEPLTYAELEALARQKSSLVYVRGQWVQLDAREIESALRFWKKGGRQTATLQDLMRISLGGGEGPGGLDVDGVTATGWVADLLSGMQDGSGIEPLPAPAGFEGALRPYQQRGYEWLSFLSRWSMGACLADDMGLGKTAQTLAFTLARWKESGRPSLVVCPTSVVGNWQREAGRFTPELPIAIHHGQTRRRESAFAASVAGQGLVITSYGLLHRDVELFRSVEWEGVILDEAQNIKNPETKQSKAARSLPSGWRIALTGTPVENHVGDLWSLFEFLNPGFLGTQTEFRRRFFYPIQGGHDPEAAGRLRKLTQPFILRRLKTDKSIIADLPDKLEMKVFCNLTREQASLYEAVVKDMTGELDEVEGIQRRGMVLAALTKLKQVCNHPAQFLGDNSRIPGRSGKLARLTEMLEEAVSEGDRALIFTQYAEMGEIIRRHLEETFGREVLFLHGGVSKARRDRMVERFQAEGADLPFFVLSLKAGGVGINLTAANHVFHFDRWWNPAVENQATDRAFRIGQKKNVQVHKFLCAGTLEEKIDELIERKRAVAGEIVSAGEAWLTELSTTELKDLFRLRRDAVSAE